MSQDPNVRPLSGHVDLLEMARFLVLPGAQQLLEAFSRIPPGELRMSVITHAEVIARTYTQAPPEQQMPDPLYMAGTGTMPVTGPVAAALEPPKRVPLTEEEHIVKLRLEGRNKLEIMAAIPGVTRQAIEGAIRHARKAGVKLPPTELPAKTKKAFATSVEEISGQGVGNIRRAARKYGHTLESYMAARKTLLEMRLAKKPIDEISAAIKPTLPDKVLWQWIYNARAAGLDLLTALDYEDAEIEPPPVAQEAPPAASKPEKVRSPPGLVPHLGRPVFAPLAALHSGSLKSVTRAATLRGMTPQAYFDLRETIVLHRYGGKGDIEIWSLVGQDIDFIRNTIANAIQKGVRFPAVTSPFKPAEFRRAMAAKGVTIPQNANTGDAWRGGHSQGRLTAREFPLRVEDASEGVLSSIHREGLKEGQTIEDYFVLRRQALDLMRQNLGNSEIAGRLGITVKQAANWRQRARAAGHLPPLKKAVA